MSSKKKKLIHKSSGLLSQGKIETDSTLRKNNTGGANKAIASNLE